MYFVYFVLPEPNSEFIGFGHTKKLAERWQVYLPNCPEPELVGLVICESKSQMLQLEVEIPSVHLKDSHYNREWLHRTSEVKAFYEDRTNVDIQETISTMEEERRKKFYEYRREYRKRPGVRERELERRREYRKIPKVRERNIENSRRWRQRKKRYKMDNNQQLTLFS